MQDIMVLEDSSPCRKHHACICMDACSLDHPMQCSMMMGHTCRTAETTESCMQQMFLHLYAQDSNCCMLLAHAQCAITDSAALMAYPRAGCDDNFSVFFNQLPPESHLLLIVLVYLHPLLGIHGGQAHGHLVAGLLGSQSRLSWTAWVTHGCKPLYIAAQGC